MKRPTKIGPKRPTPEIRLKLTDQKGIGLNDPDFEREWD